MIIFSGITKRFGEQPPALHDVTFTINDGELAVITGPSGSGKTSLMRLLTKEYHPDAGEITFHGTPLSEIRPGELHHHRRKIGVVFQDYKLLQELNVWENIALALSIIGAPTEEVESRVTDLLKLVNLTEKAFLFPNQLSGGEAQRVSIARALSTAPKVIFADEPTGNLDPDTSKTIVQLLHKINKLGTTVMITTHDPIVLQVLDKARHLKMESGKVITDNGAKVSSTKEKPSTTAPIKTPDEDETVIVEITTLDDEPSPHVETKNQSVTAIKPTTTHSKSSESKPVTKKRINIGLPSFLKSIMPKKEPVAHTDHPTTKSAATSTESTFADKKPDKEPAHD